MFVRNFLYSSLAYIISNHIWNLAYIYIGTAVDYYGMTNFADGNDTVPWVLWYGALVTQSALSFTMFFFLGKRLNLLGSNLWNFLSVSGSLVFAVLAGIIFWPFVILAIYPFLLLTEAIEYVAYPIVGEFASVLIAVFVSPILAPIITWLGILHKSKGNKTIADA